MKTIKITIYRLAQISHIASSLINAAINGKSVTVSIELRARFDEQANIDYAEQMQSEGSHSPNPKMNGDNVRKTG